MALNDAIGTDREAGVAGGMQRMEGCAVGFGSIIQSGDAHIFAASPILQDAKVDFLHQLSCSMSTKKFDEGKTVIQEATPSDLRVTMFTGLPRARWRFGRVATL